VPDIRIRLLGPHDASAFQALRLQALRECPEAFGSTYAEDKTLPLEVIAERLTPTRTPVGQAVFGAFVEDELVGVAGCRQESKAKARHKGVVWGMYVRPPERGRGVGRGLLQHIITEARLWPDVERLVLTVVERAAAARHLYVAMGFITFGREPDGLRQDGFRDTVEYLALPLARDE
jgi:GNAT superfamily N-acetyltransferase